jgi:hypothetical protein
MDELHRHLFSVLMDREWKLGVAARSTWHYWAGSMNASPTTPSRSHGESSSKPPENSL